MLFRSTDGLVPIYQRVTIDGQRIEQSTKRYVEISKWSSEAGKLKGNSEEARSLNNYLDILKAKVYDYQKELIHETGFVTLESMRNKILGVQERPLTIIPIFKDHNQKLKALQGSEYSKGTITRYETALKHTLNFLKFFILLKFIISDFKSKLLI